MLAFSFFIIEGIKMICKKKRKKKEVVLQPFEIVFSIFSNVSDDLFYRGE